MDTTIAVSNAVKDEIKAYGNKGETYDAILKRLLESARERELQDLLMSKEDCIDINEALKKAKKRWQ